jgi:hypothetical protein
MKSRSVLLTITAVSLFVSIAGSRMWLVAADGAWTTKGPISSARYFSEAAVVNGVLYTAGGWNGCTPYSNVEAYDPTTDTWTARAPMLTARGYHGVAALDGLLYAAGGAIGCGVGTANVEAYDPLTNSWSSRAPLPTARYAHAVVAANGKIYAIGGSYSNGPAEVGLMTEYDPATNSWIDRAPMPTPRGLLAATVANGIVYVIGGGSSLTSVEAYDPATDTWSAKAPLPVGRNSLGAASLDGLVFAMGGQPSCSGLAQVDVYDPTTDAWSPGVSMPTPRRNFGAAVLNGSIYVIGGYVQYDCAANQGPVSSVIAFTPVPEPTPTPTPTPTPAHQYVAHVQAPIDADGSSVFTVRRGVVPVKFLLSDFGNSTCALPPAMIVVTRTAGGVMGEVNESVYSGFADQGTSFRVDNCQYVYNLNSGALGAGTYSVDVLIDNQVAGSGVFQLR